MQCPRCKSSRIQRGYHAVAFPFRLIGVHELLCNICNLEFKRFDPLGKFKRAPSGEKDPAVNRRRAPRYRVHLPANIHLAEKSRDTGKVTYSQPARGHCEVIGKFGVALAFVGTRFAEQDLARKGRLLFVTIQLPDSRIEALITVLMHHRSGNEDGKGKWFIGGSFSNLSEEDTARLAAYLDKRALADR
jgi:hypothetical protein